MPLNISLQNPKMFEIIWNVFHFFVFVFDQRLIKDTNTPPLTTPVQNTSYKIRNLSILW